MNFKNIIFVLIVILFIFQIIVTKESKKEKADNSKPLVALSTFSLYDVAKHISGDSIKLIMILPFGVDAHSFEPTPKLMADIDRSDLVVYSGAGLEPWIDGFEFKNRVINMSEHVRLREMNPDAHHHGHHHKNHNSIDPHYWQDIENMVLVTNLISEELIKISPKNRELYLNNRDNYVKMLKKLDNDYRSSLSTCQGDTIIVNHNAFSYLANNYNFSVEALSGLSPEAQPSAKNMIKLIEHVKEHNISTIFFESFVSDKAIKNIAAEAKVSVDILQPLGNITADEADKNLTFEDIMRMNLDKISKAMKCQ
ncbi:MAG: metal ABC transporter substrate-binding protein [Campylobacterota bacterium]|nr:metal ABC transporter substrate-binding protein [Campylobacterota bacterium]